MLDFIIFLFIEFSSSNGDTLSSLTNDLVEKVGEFAEFSLADLVKAVGACAAKLGKGNGGN